MFLFATGSSSSAQSSSDDDIIAVWVVVGVAAAVGAFIVSGVVYKLLVKKTHKVSMVPVNN